MGSITVGEILTIVTIIVGLVVQYGAIIVKFSERITRIETKQEDLERNIKDRHDTFVKIITKDIDSLFDAVRSCKDKKEVNHDI